MIDITLKGILEENGNRKKSISVNKRIVNDMLWKRTARAKKNQ